MNKDNKQTVDYEALNKKRLDRNLMLVDKPDAIVIIPFAKPNRYALAKMVIHVDKVVANLKRQIGFDMDFDRAKELLNSLGEFIDDLWLQVIKVSPNLYAKTKEDWRQVNDPVDHRRLLAHRKMCIVLAPRSEEAGQAAIAVKIIENRNLDVRTTATSFDNLKEITEDYCKIVEDFDTFLARLSAEAGMEYKSPLTPREKTPSGTAKPV